MMSCAAVWIPHQSYSRVAYRGGGTGISPLQLEFPLPELGQNIYLRLCQNPSHTM